MNGRVFLNFSGLGLHPAVVRQRDLTQEAIGGTRVLGRFFRKAVKVVAGIIAFVAHLGRLPLLRMSIHTGAGKFRRVTPSVVVCNNAHQMKVFGVETASYPGRHVLNVYVAKARGPVSLIRLTVAALFRRLDTANARDFEVLPLPALRINLRRRRLPVSIDGEVVEMETPLEYRVRRGGLKVIAPGGGAVPSAGD